MQSLVLDPPSLYQAIDKIALMKVSSPKLKVSILGFIAGCFVAIGAQTFIGVTAEEHTPPYLILGGAMFSTALMGIILCGSELFTGNCLMMMAVFEGHCSFLSVLWEWFFVYCGNLVGVIAFAALNHGGGINLAVDGSGLTVAGQRLCAVAVKKANLHPQEMFFRAWLANFCVCFAVLMAISSKSVAGKVYACIFPIACFVVDGYEHSIANMYFFSAAAMSRCPAMHSRYWLNLLLVTLGNFFGATILSVVYWKCYLHRQSPALDSQAPSANASVDAAQPSVYASSSARQL
jgi:formate/nitrite transporter